MDEELRENYASFSGETEETKVRFKALSTDHILNEGITIGEERARRSIMERLIATGMTPGQAASLTGVSAGTINN